MTGRAGMKIADIMRKEVVVVDERSTVAEVARVLVACSEDLALPISKGKPLGVVTSYDITSHLGKGGSPKKWVSRIMTSPIMSVTPYEDVEQALQHMETQRLRKYPVIMGRGHGHDFGAGHGREAERPHQVPPRGADHRHPAVRGIRDIRLCPRLLEECRMIRAKTIMNANPPVLQAADTMQQAAKKLVAKNAKIGLIFNRGGFMGIITEEMIFSEVIINRKVGAHTPVGNLARRDFSSIDAKTPFSRIERGFRENQKSRFVVTEHGTPVR